MKYVTYEVYGSRKNRSCYRSNQHTKHGDTAMNRTTTTETRVQVIIRWTPSAGANGQLTLSSNWRVREGA